MRRWRPRRSGGRAGARRAGVTALVLLTVTAVLAVLLAVRYHLAWPPVVVAILGTLPALYLAWAALPGAVNPPEHAAARKPAYGRLVCRWDPVKLGVHQVIGGGPTPTYVRRPHDELLRAVLDPAVPTSRLVVVRGGSSTGKTRAAYEAVTGRLPDWQLDYPLDPGALNARLEAGIPARTVLWLGELRQYADADADGGAAVLGRLADLLEGEGHLVITTMWPEQWNTYTASTTRRPLPGCWERCTRPGPATRSPPWPSRPPTRACSSFSFDSTLTRPPCSGASQTEPHRNPGNGMGRLDQRPPSYAATWDAGNGAVTSPNGGYFRHHV